MDKPSKLLKRYTAYTSSLVFRRFGGDPASDGPHAASRGRSVDIPPPAPRREGTLDSAESVCVAPVERVGRLVLPIDYRRASRRSDSRPGTCVLVWTTSIRERPGNSPVGEEWCLSLRCLPDGAVRVACVTHGASGIFVQFDRDGPAPSRADGPTRARREFAGGAARSVTSPTSWGRHPTRLRLQHRRGGRRHGLPAGALSSRSSRPRRRH